MAKKNYKLTTPYGDETSAARRSEITTIISDGYDQTIEQSLYCAYGYGDCFTAGKCVNCSMVSYSRDCRNNPI
jgi:hypothetical protein